MGTGSAQRLEHQFAIGGTGHDEGGGTGRRMDHASRASAGAGLLQQAAVGGVSKDVVGAADGEH